MLNIFVYVSRGDSLWQDYNCAHSPLSLLCGHFCVCEQSRLCRDYTCAQFPLSLLWSLMLNILVYVSMGDCDETALLCMWSGTILTKQHMCTVSSEPSLVTYVPYICVCEQRRLWHDYTSAQSPLSLRLSLILNIFMYVWEQGENLTRLHLCIVFSEPSLVTYTQYSCDVSRGDSEETALVHDLRAFAGHLCSIFLCMWAE